MAKSPKAPARPRTKANEAAEAAYRKKFAQVLVRFTPDEVAALDDARGDAKRPEFVKAKTMAAVAALTRRLKGRAK